jgi:hypothetical protein
MSVKLLYNPETPQFACAGNYCYVNVGRHLVHQMDNMIDVYEKKHCKLSIPLAGVSPIFSITMPADKYIVDGIRSSLTSHQVKIWCQDTIKCQELIVTITATEITVKIASRVMFFTFKPADRYDKEAGTRVMRKIYDSVQLNHLACPFVDYIRHGEYFCIIDGHDIGHVKFGEIYKLLNDDMEFGDKFGVSYMEVSFKD